MISWREIFGCEDEDPSFDEVHNSFRNLMKQPNLEPARVLELSAALEQARRELGTKGRPSGG